MIAIPKDKLRLARLVEWQFENVEIRVLSFSSNISPW